MIVVTIRFSFSLFCSPVHRLIDLLLLFRRAEPQIDRRRVQTLMPEHIGEQRDILVLFQKKDRKQVAESMRMQHFLADPVFEPVFLIWLLIPLVDIRTPYLSGNRYTESTVLKYSRFPGSDFWESEFCGSCPSSKV